MEQNFGMLVLNATSIARTTQYYAVIVDEFDPKNLNKMKAVRADSLEGKPKFVVYPDGSYEKYDVRKIVDYAVQAEDWFDE